MTEHDRTVVRVTKWAGLTFGGLLAAAIFAGAVNWCGDISKRVGAIETKLAYMDGDRVRILEEYRVFQNRIEAVLQQLLSRSESQGKLLSRVEAQIEGLKK